MSAVPRDEDAGKRKSRFGLMACMVVVLAFVLREQFVLAGIVDYPIAGDIRDYFFYALNLVQNGTFSMVPPDAGPAIADAYRSPGYPWLLAACLKLWPQDPGAPTLGTWYPMALQLQVLLGTASVLLAMLFARFCVSGTWALLAGLLLALWPHHIAATGTLLSEVAFGFSLLAGLYCTALAWKSNRKVWWIAAGACFGYAYLINAVVLFFPLMVAVAAWWKRHRAGAISFALVFLLPVALLALRNAGIPRAADAPVGRAAINFVQGSWPNYHKAHSLYRSGDATAVAIIDEINREAALLERDPRQGARRISARLASAPSWYLRWYAWDKPWLLWDWNIRIGHGGFYFQDVRRSPLDRAPLRQLFAAFEALNPLFTFIALFGAIAVLAVRRIAPASRMVAGMLLYFTLIHVVFQAEPRYANAYRGIEVVMIVVALSWIAGRLRGMIPGTEPNLTRPKVTPNVSSRTTIELVVSGT